MTTLSSVEVRTARPYPVRIGPGALGCVAELIDGPCMILSDEHVSALHRERLGGLEAPLELVPRGEEAKGFTVLEGVLEAMARQGLDRSSTLVTLGGGVVGDLGGLAASLYMRGIDVVHAPTTLLAQVDASVGGKTAVNLAAGKNLAGTFHQPRAVLADTDVLATLEEDELRSGLGEVVKSAIVGSAALFELLESEADAVLARDPRILARVVELSVRVKAAVVEEDERESHTRKKLNLGHTFAHAIEHAAGYGHIPHGIAVATGIALAADVSRRLETLADPGLPERIGALLDRLGLASGLAELGERFGVAFAPAELVEGMRHDKKGRVGRPALVLPRRIGELALDVDAPPEVLRAAIDKAARV